MNMYKKTFFFLLILISQIINIKTGKSKIDKISQNIEKSKNKDELNSAIKQEKDLFEKQIEAFTLSEFTTFELPAKSGEYIYYHITSPCVLTFTFYLSDIEKLISLNLKGAQIKKKFLDKNFLFYELKIEKEGKYIFYLDNEKNEEKVEISFAIKDSAKKDENIGSKKLDKITEYIEDMESKINKIRLKQNIINKKTDAHNEGVNKHNKNILINSFYEVLIMIFILVAQLYYIKKNISKI